MQVIVSEKSSSSNLWVQHAQGSAVLLSSLCSWSRVPKNQARALLDISYTSVRCLEFELSRALVLIVCNP
jgi:hypothetical protein